MVIKKAKNILKKVAKIAKGSKTTSDKKSKAETKKIVKKLDSKTKAKPKTEKVVKQVKSTKTASHPIKSKDNKRITEKEIKKNNKVVPIEDFDENDDTGIYEKPIDFTFKGKEKDLEKQLKEDDDIFVDTDDDADKDPDDPKDEDIIATEEFEGELDNYKNSSFVDIFEGVSLDDPVRMYLKEIGQHDLLSQDKEQILAKQKQEAQRLLRKKKLNDQLPMNKIYASRFTDEELKIIKRGELSQERLINCNLRLVVSIAKRFVGHGLSLLDLIQEGNLGLIRGIEKFDYKMGFKLSTYVTWWIRQAVSRALADQSKTIRIPVHMVETINRLNKVKKKLTSELGYEPSTKQIAKAMKVSEEKVEEVLQIAMDPISLDKPVGDEDDSIVADFIADQNALDPETYAERVMLKERIEELLDGLKEREKKVLLLRFGIEDDHPRTLEEVGKELNVTRERIRQIEDKALRKLKYRAKNLHESLK